MKSSIQTRFTEFKAEIDQKLTALRDLVKQTIAKHDETTEKLVEEVQEATKELRSKKNKLGLILLERAMLEDWDKRIITYKLAHENT